MICSPQSKSVIGPPSAAYSTPLMWTGSVWARTFQSTQELELSDAHVLQNTGTSQTQRSEGYFYNVIKLRSVM